MTEVRIAVIVSQNCWHRVKPRKRRKGAKSLAEISIKCGPDRHKHRFSWSSQNDRKKKKEKSIIKISYKKDNNSDEKRMTMGVYVSECV